MCIKRSVGLSGRNDLMDVTIVQILMIEDSYVKVRRPTSWCMTSRTCGACRRSITK